MTELFKEFQEFRKILCVCPCCGEISRVSDLRLKAKAPAVKTWLDTFEDKVQKFGLKVEKFEEKEEELREVARAKGRKAAEKAVNKAITPELRKLKLDPFDVKPILNPIDFVVFKGMYKRDDISSIILLSKQLKNPAINIYRGQVEKAVKDRKYEWQVARINDKGCIDFE